MAIKSETFSLTYRPTPWPTSSHQSLFLASFLSHQARRTSIPTSDSPLLRNACSFRPAPCGELLPLFPSALLLSPQPNPGGPYLPDPNSGARLGSFLGSPRNPAGSSAFPQNFVQSQSESHVNSLSAPYSACEELKGDLNSWAQSKVPGNLPAGLGLQSHGPLPNSEPRELSRRRERRTSSPCASPAAGLCAAVAAPYVSHTHYPDKKRAVPLSSSISIWVPCALLPRQHGTPASPGGGGVSFIHLCDALGAQGDCAPGTQPSTRGLSKHLWNVSPP